MLPQSKSVGQMEYMHAVHDYKRWSVESEAYNSTIKGIATSVEDGYEHLVGNCMHAANDANKMLIVGCRRSQRYSTSKKVQMGMLC